VTVAVTIDGLTGRAVHVDMRGDWDGTHVDSCVQAQIGQRTFPTFDGNRETFRHRYEIR